MQENLTHTKTTQFVFRPNPDEKADFITNEYLKNMPRDENLRYELIGGEIIVSTVPRFIHQLMEFRITLEIGMYLRSCLKTQNKR